jgi:hypothetical protein
MPPLRQYFSPLLMVGVVVSTAYHPKRFVAEVDRVAGPPVRHRAAQLARLGRLTLERLQLEQEPRHSVLPPLSAGTERHDEPTAKGDEDPKQRMLVLGARRRERSGTDDRCRSGASFLRAGSTVVLGRRPNAGRPYGDSFGNSVSVIAPTLVAVILMKLMKAPKSLNELRQ